MKVYTSKFTDSFFLPVKNSSCRDELAYQVTVNDTYGILSIENTVGPGPKNDLYITVPKVPSIGVAQGTLYAKRSDSGEYYIEISSVNTLFKVYENGKRFYIFYSDGTYSKTHADFMGYDGDSPQFLIEEGSLLKLLGGSSLPTTTPVLLNSPYSLSTEFETQSFLKVSTATDVKGIQTASVTLRGLQTTQQAQVYDFIIDPVDPPVQRVGQPPDGLKYTETSQLARSFVPVSSVVTLQVDSSGELYMDRLYSGSTESQTGYRRRCTNLGFEKDLSRFCSSIPKPALYSFFEEDFKSSTTNLSEQYFTNINAGATINRETQEGFRMFAPLWLKDRIPSYFAIFRKAATNISKDLLDGASLVTLIDIEKTELGPYLRKLISNEAFSKAPLEVSIDQSYSLRWNGVSVETGYWVSHTEFIGIDIEDGLSDFEFNEILSGGFSRGSMVCPQFLNIEFLFDDKEAKLYEVNQYFGLYCDDIELSRFIPNVESTATLFRQNETRASSNNDFNSSVISNKDGVRLVVDLNETPDRNLLVSDPSTMVVSSIKVPSSYKIQILPTSSASRSLRASFSSDSDVTSAFPSGSKVRLQDQYMDLVSYLTVSSAAYSSEERSVTLVFVENDTYSRTKLDYWINVFDFDPDPSPSINGRMRFDSPDAAKAGCMVLSNKDLLGNDIQTWASSVVDVSSRFRDCLVIFDKSSSAYAILLASSVDSGEEYTKIFFDVIESSGEFSEGEEVFINLSEYDIEGAVPGPKLVGSKTRKFILKPKQGAYSVKSFDLSNYKNDVIGILSLDSTTFDLGSIVGTSSGESIPAELVSAPYTGVGITLPSLVDDIMSYGDRITVEQTIGETKRRWSVIRSERNGPQVSKTSGAMTDVPIVAGTLSSDGYTELEIEGGGYFPVRFDTFELTTSTSGASTIQLSFVSAEQQENGNYLLTFSDSGLSTDYQALRVTSAQEEFTYFDYGPGDSIPTVLSVAFQRFSDCPVRSATSDGTLYLYSSASSTDISIGIYAPYGTIVQSKINGASIRPKSVVKETDTFHPDFYVYTPDSLKDSVIYSIQNDFLAGIENGTKVLSRSGAPLTASKWNNGIYGIPDIRSIVEEGEERVLVKFDGTREASLLNGRLQLINTNTVALSMLSFYDFIDLDFFEEIPVRLGTRPESEIGISFNQNSSIFSQRVQTAQTASSTTSTSNQKSLVLSVNIAENIYSDWANWDPSNVQDFLSYGSPKGSSTPSDTFPTSWNPSYGFKIQYLNPSGEWVDYQMSYPTATMAPPVVKYYSVLPHASPMWQMDFADPLQSPPDYASFSDVSVVFNTIVLYMYSASFSERTRGFSELKRLASYCFNQLSNNVDQAREVGTYVHRMVLSVDEEHLDYRYVTTFPEGTYTVTEEEVISVVGGSAEANRRLTGVPRENITSNFAASIVSSGNKTRPTLGRWKKRSSANVDLMPYTINVDPLLLSYDMFVDGTENGLSTSSFPLDWYLISGWPKFYSLDDAGRNYQYIGKRVTLEELTSVEHDYFTDALTVGHGEETFTDGTERPKNFLWSTIEAKLSEYSTMFKGLPLSISSPKIDLSGSRFAAILQVERGLEVPTKVTLVYNKTWRALTLLVQLNVDSYFIDGSIGLEQLYSLRINEARTDSSKLYGPMMVHGSKVLSFNAVDRAYNETETVVLNAPVQSDNHYEYNQYQYRDVVRLKYDYSAKDIELFGVRYYPNVDYIITGDIFFGTKNQTRVSMVVPRSRLRGVFDPEAGYTRTFIDGLYGDNFFAVVSDVDGAPLATYATFVYSNTVQINGSVMVSNSYYQMPTAVAVDSTTRIVNSVIHVVGDWPVYRDTVSSASVTSVLSKVQSFDFNDILVDQIGTSRTNITMSYMKPSVVRPSKTKNASIDEFGNVLLREQRNDLSLFRVDGGFEPSYRSVLSFAAAEDLSITRQTLNSFKGFNTNLLGILPLNVWYRRVSEQGVSTGNINVNGQILKVPYALGRKSVQPLEDVWAPDFYSRAADSFIDVPVDGLDDPKECRFFLSSKSMSVPTFFRTSTYSCLDASVPSSHGSASVTYIPGQSRLTVNVDLSSVVSDYLATSGVLEFFLSIPTDLNPYGVSKEYIERNLLDIYSVESIDIYQRPSTRTEVVSIDGSPEQQGFVFVDSIGIEAKRIFDFSIPVDGSKQTVLAFNIKRR
jgi:hypothetical protein